MLGDQGAMVSTEVGSPSGILSSSGMALAGGVDPGVPHGRHYLVPLIAEEALGGLST